MSFIPGRFISKLVKEQLNARQALLNQSDRLTTEGVSADAFSFFTKKVPFIRMTSAIDISTEKGPDGKYINYKNDSAKAHVLDSGALSAITAGIPAGYEEVTSLGIRPKPGIIQMNLRTHNRFGSLRTATVEFKVHSVEQLDTYEELYLRPGHTVLLEWGNNLYLDGKKKEVSEIPVLLSDDFLNQTNGVKSKQDIHNRIKELRADYHFNYDAMYGQVKNFSWKIRPDGGYDCTVDIVSIGNVLESMTLNVSILNNDLSIYRKFKREKAKDTVGTASTPTELLVDSSQEKGLDEEESKIYKAIIEPMLDKYLPVTERSVLFGLFTTEYGGWELAAKEKTARQVLTTQKFGSKAQVVGVLAGTAEDVVQGFTIVTTGYRTDLPGSNVRVFSDTSEFQKLKDASFVSYADPTVEYYLEVIGNSSRRLPGRSRGEASYIFFSITYELKQRPATTTLVGPGVESPQAVPGPVVVNADYIQSADNLDGLQQDTLLDEILREINIDLTSRIHLYLFLLSDYIKSNIDVSKDYRGTFQEDLVRYKEQVIPLDKTGIPFTSEYTQGLRRAKITPREEGQQITSDDFYNYIQLGTFIDMLNFFLPATSTDGEKLFAFHTSKDVIHRHKTLPKLHTSVDISKCILPRSYKLKGNAVNRGDILDIFVEIDYLREVVTRNLAAGDIKVYDVVTTVLQDIVVSTGQINSFELQYFEDTSKFHIVDRELIDPDSQKGTEIPKLNVIGRKTTVLNLDLTSKLSPAIGAQIAIAAQEEPYSNGIESSGWARFSEGLRDRYKPFVSSDLDALLKEQQNAAEKLAQLQSSLGLVFKYLEIVYGSSAVEQVTSSLPSILTPYATLCKIRLAELTGKGGKQFGIILPYELSITLEGISGFNVMESFSINDEILPRSYRNEGGIAFLITGLQHSVSPQGWTTSIKAQIYNTSKNGALVEGELLPDPTPQPKPAPLPEEESVVDSTQGYKGILWDVKKGRIVSNLTKDSNVKLIIDAMVSEGISSREAMIGILSVIGKESGFVPQNEVTWRNTSISRIRQFFTTRVASKTDSELEQIKKDDKRFFELVYGPEAAKNDPKKWGWLVEGEYPQRPGDGYLYRGRGFNQVTFRTNYAAYDKKTGTGILDDPDKLNSPANAALVSVRFLVSNLRTVGKDVNSLTSKDDAVYWCTRANAGGKEIRNSETYKNAVAVSKQFDIA